MAGKHPSRVLDRSNKVSTPSVADSLRVVLIVKDQESHLRDADGRYTTT